MKPENAIRERDNLKAAVRLLMFFVVVIGFGLFYLGFKVERAANSQRTILIPGLDSKIEFTGDDLSDESADLYARRVVMLRASFSPGTVRKNFNQLLKLFAPESYPDAWKLYYDFADKIETANVTSTYFIDKIEINKQNKTIIVTGENRKFKNNTPLSDAVIQYTIGYRIDQGQFQVLNIDEKEKSK